LIDERGYIVQYTARKVHVGSTCILLRTILWITTKYHLQWNNMGEWRVAKAASYGLSRDATLEFVGGCLDSRRFPHSGGTWPGFGTDGQCLLPPCTWEGCVGTRGESRIKGTMYKYSAQKGKCGYGSWVCSSLRRAIRSYVLRTL
jgi:hypothetical protein